MKNVSKEAKNELIISVNSVKMQMRVCICVF